VQDDGPGINLTGITQRALQAGLLTPETAVKAPASHLLALLFQPGFSTAAQVNDLSGRGVGLDVVQSQIQALKGSVNISFSPNQGSTFALQIPLTLSIAKLLVCQSQGILYAFPLDAIEQIVTPQSEQLKLLGHQWVFYWGQNDSKIAVPIRSLPDLISYHDHPSGGQGGSNVNLLNSTAITLNEAQLIILLRTDHGFTGLKVDHIIGEQELIIRPLNLTIAPPPYVYGSCIVGNNQLALVLDAKTLLKTEQLHSKPVISHNEASQSRPIRILLIEDSLTVRQTLTQRLLQENYQVEQAQDGLDAIIFLQQNPNIDLIICDVEMPRMNGFEFLAQRSQNPALSLIPVIMLTSRTTEKYRHLAGELGASAFLTKPYIENDLLHTIREFLVKS
jgi:two-component system, chemotaxis family, sensor histidine kinase and response regulator PixL